jgi:hypothetical protein
MQTKSRRMDDVDRLLWGLAVAIAVSIVVFSLGPAVGETLFPNADKLFHAGAYGSLAFVVLLAGAWRPGRGEGRWPTKTRVILAAVIGMGVAVELVQPIFARDADPFDGLADAVGALAALGLWMWLKHSRRVSPSEA